MQHWLVKQEPETYPWSSFVHDKGTVWDGVRNFQARNNLRLMKKGDQVLYYHSGSERAVVGLAKVTKTAFPDPTATEGDWSAVELKPVRGLHRAVPLAEIKEKSELREIALIRQSRLSVMPLKEEEFSLILALAEAPAAG